MVMPLSIEYEEMSHLMSVEYTNTHRRYDGFGLPTARHCACDGLGPSSHPRVPKKLSDRTLLSFQRPRLTDAGVSPVGGRRFKCDQRVYPRWVEFRKARGPAGTER